MIQRQKELKKIQVRDKFKVPEFYRDSRSLGQTAMAKTPKVAGGRRVYVIPTLARKQKNRYLHLTISYSLRRAQRASRFGLLYIEEALSLLGFYVFAITVFIYVQDALLLLSCMHQHKPSLRRFSSAFLWYISFSKNNV